MAILIKVDGRKREWLKFVRECVKERERRERERESEKKVIETERLQRKGKNVRVSFIE